MDFPNFKQCSDSPSFADEELGIKAAFKSGAAKIGMVADDRWLVFGSLRLDAEGLAEVGSSVASEVLIILTYWETRSVHLGRLTKAAPSARRQRTVGGGDDSGGGFRLMDAYFNLDLKATCSVDPHPGHYWVVFQLGKFVSQVLEFEVVAPPA
jgi:hypothetical protein